MDVGIERICEGDGQSKGWFPLGLVDRDIVSLLFRSAFPKRQGKESSIVVFVGLNVLPD
jgi:hypothetical protein